MRKITNTNKQKKLFILLIIILVVSIIIGLLFTAILSDSSHKLVASSITNFIESINKGELNYQGALINSLGSNTLYSLLIFFLGMSIIGAPIILFLFMMKGFTLGFSVSSIFYVYGIKGILITLVYVLPQLINIGALLILSYFSCLFSKHLFRLLFLHEEISFKKIMKRYIKVLIVVLIVMIISSLIETFLVPSVISLLQIKK